MICKRIFKLTFSAALSFLLLLNFAYAAGGNSIQGGRSVGSVCLGQNINQVRSILGAPSKVVRSQLPISPL